MPEFRVSWKDSLNRALGNLGIVSAFDPNEADLKFMLPNAERAFVKKVSDKLKERKVSVSFRYYIKLISV